MTSKIKQVFAGTSDSGKHISMSKKNKKLFLALFTALLLVAAVIGIAAGVKRNSGGNDNNFHPSHTIIKSACSSTLYPELCFSAIAAEPGITEKVSGQRNVIEASLNITTRAVQHNYFNIEKLLTRKGLTEREKTAPHDCLETIDETLEELHKTKDELKQYLSTKSLSEQADDLKTLISAAITNQDTCLDGFSHDKADKHVREALEDGQVYVEKLCSNALSMIKNMTDSDIANYEKKISNGIKYRKLLEANEEEENGIKWPEWMSAADRRILQATTVTADVVVAADGSGNFKTVAAAVAAVPEKSSKRYVIRIKAGVYRENVEVPNKKSNIMFFGDDRANTIITGSRNVVDGSTTFHSATVVPFPNRLMQHQLNRQFIKFLNVLKQLHINLPFIDALMQISNYAKFLKKVITNKRKLDKGAVVALTEECSAILQNKLPQKLKDPMSFSIPYNIGSLSIKNALCDLGANINLMPYTVYKKLGLGERRQFDIVLQLADRSIKHPLGIIEDVLIKVNKFIFPVNFVVLDMEEDIEIPIILRRSFFAINRAIIDVQQGTLTFKINENKVIFSIFDFIKCSPLSNKTCCAINHFYEGVDSKEKNLLCNDFLKLCLLEGESDKESTMIFCIKAAQLDGPLVQKLNHEASTWELKPA